MRIHSGYSLTRRSVRTRLLAAACIAAWAGVFCCGWLQAADVKLKAVVLIPAGTPGEYQVISLQKFKLNGKGEVRRIETDISSPSTQLAKDQYKKLPKLRLESLTVIELRNGVPYASDSAGSSFPCLPDDYDFDKARSAAVSAFTAAPFEGEGRDQTPKGKKILRLGEVHKIYFVPESTALEDVSFRNAREENTVETWRAFVKTHPRFSRLQEAKTQFQARLLHTARTAFDKFSKGSYASLAAANQALAEAESVLPGEENAARLRSEAQSAEAAIHSSIAVGENMLKAGDPDGAIENLQPIAKYRSEIAALNDVHQKALLESNRLHRQKGASLLKSEKLEEAQKEYEFALSRLPDSAETLGELNEAKIRIGLRDTNRMMARKEYAAALEKITQLTKTVPADSRLHELSGQVKKARGQEIYAQTRPLYEDPMPRDPRLKGTPPKPRILVSRDDETKHLTALRYLEEAGQLDSDERIYKDVQMVRRRLSDYYVTQAKRAEVRPKGTGAAYLYYARAQALDPSRSDLSPLVEAGRARFTQRATIRTAVRVRNLAGTGHGQSFATQLEASVANAIRSAEVPGLAVVEGSAGGGADDQSVLRSLALDGSAAAAVLADVTVSNVRSRDQTFQRPSRFVANEWTNPKWQEYENQSDYWDSQWDACRKQFGNDNPTCQQYRAQKEQFSRLRNSVPQLLQDIRIYNVLERQVHMEVSQKVSYRFADSLSAARGPAQVLDGADNAQGKEISGVADRDMSGYRNQILNLPHESQFVGNVQQRMEGQLVAKSVEYIRSLPRKYYDQAEAAAARGSDEEALEGYAAFLYATPEKGSIEAGKAQSFLKQKFNLAFDGNLR